MSNFLPSVESFAKGTVATAAGFSTVGLGLLYYGQNYLIYPSAYPPGSRTDVPQPNDFGLPHEDLVLTTSDNVRIRSYLLLQRRDLGKNATYIDMPAGDDDASFIATRPTVMMFHGNGGNHGHRLPLAKVFYMKMRCNVLMLSYRGYGLSEGSPSEKGLVIDSQTALDYITSHPQLSQTSIILYGQSIGGAVSVDLASRNPQKIRALILENTFTSLPSLIPTTIPFLSPFTFLCHQKWDSISKVPLIPPSTPILMMSGLRDEIIPPIQMRNLWAAFAALRGGPRLHPRAKSKDGEEGGEEEKQSKNIILGRNKFLTFAKGSHNDTCVQPGYWAAVSQFVAELDL